MHEPGPGKAMVLADNFAYKVTKRDVRWAWGQQSRPRIDPAAPVISIAIIEPLGKSRTGGLDQSRTVLLMPQNWVGVDVYW